MASNPVYQQNGNHANGKSSQNPSYSANNGNSLHKSSSSHFMMPTGQAHNGKMEPPPNGYRVAPTKIPTKAEIDYHLENFIMSRKIALNGGNELRIDDKNISLHLNNNAPYQQKIYMQPPFPNNLMFNETINETTLTADQARPKRPHSIAVSSPINLNTSLNNDLNVATLTRRQKITTPNIITGGMMNKVTTTAAGEQQKMNSQYCSPINFSHFNGNGSSPSPGRMQAPFRSLKSEFSLYTPPSPVAVSETNGGIQQKQPPNVPQRRSQSIPRQVMTQNFTSTNGQPITGIQTLNRPRSLDRYSNVGVRTTNAHSSPHNQHVGAMKQSITFHGQQMLNQACYQGDIYEEVGLHKQPTQKKDRPISFAYGTVPEQVYLDNQLRMYQEQLKNITESMKKYQEQAKILNELKRQQSLDRQKSTVPMSKSDSKLSQGLKLSTTNLVSAVGDEVQTPSHQLRLFLDNIRNSIKEPSASSSFDNDVSDHEADVKSDAALKVVNKVDEKINVHQSKPNNVEVKTPSDQLRLFLDAIRHNQSIETHQRADAPKPQPIPEESFELKRSETFSEVTDNIKLLNQDLESFNDNSNVTSISRNMDQILDDFNRMASLLKNDNSVDYLQKCSDALKQTTEQIRQLNGANNYSSDDSSCSTTPGSIREAVQSLLSQPRNGFQIMDDRMSIFIDIMEQQDRFSQVNPNIEVFISALT